MSYPGFDKDLYGIYTSEVMGEALFATAATLSWGERSRKWRALAALESQTMARYLEYVHGRGQSPGYPYGLRLGGYMLGLLFALSPWRAAMSTLKSGTPEFIERFQRLADNAPEGESPFFDYVLQHELAITRFAKGELAGESEALADVEQLLTGAYAQVEGSRNA